MHVQPIGIEMHQLVRHPAGEKIQEPSERLRRVGMRMDASLQLPARLDVGIGGIPDPSVLAIRIDDVVTVMVHSDRRGIAFELVDEMLERSDLAPTVEAEAHVGNDHVHDAPWPHDPEPFFDLAGRIAGVLEDMATHYEIECIVVDERIPAPRGNEMHLPDMRHPLVVSVEPSQFARLPHIKIQDIGDERQALVQGADLNSGPPAQLHRRSGEVQAVPV